MPILSSILRAFAGVTFALRARPDLTLRSAIALYYADTSFGRPQEITPSALALIARRTILAWLGPIPRVFVLGDLQLTLVHEEGERPFHWLTFTHPQYSGSAQVMYDGEIGYAPGLTDDERRRLYFIFQQITS